MASNPKDLEKALSNNSGKSPKDNSQQNVSKEEEIGYHKGALNTLINERNELFKMIQAVEGIMQAHLKRLQELGVKVDFGEGKEGSKK